MVSSSTFKPPPAAFSRLASPPLDPPNPVSLFTAFPSSCSHSFLSLIAPLLFFKLDLLFILASIFRLGSPFFTLLALFFSPSRFYFLSPHLSLSWETRIILGYFFGGQPRIPRLRRVWSDRPAIGLAGWEILVSPVIDPLVAGRILARIISRKNL